MQRRVMGYNVHIPLTPDAVQHVLLDDAAKYEKPTIVKSLLAPVIGRGLLTSDGPLWRDQRRIVSASFVPRRSRCAGADLRRCGTGDHGALAVGDPRHGGPIDCCDHADHRRQPVRRRSPADQRCRVRAYHRRAGGVRRAADSGPAPTAGLRAHTDRARRAARAKLSSPHARRSGRRPLSGTGGRATISSANWSRRCAASSTARKPRRWRSTMPRPSILPGTRPPPMP